MYEYIPVSLDCLSLIICNSFSELPFAKRHGVFSADNDYLSVFLSVLFQFIYVCVCMCVCVEYIGTSNFLFHFYMSNRKNVCSRICFVFFHLICLGRVPVSVKIDLSYSFESLHSIP